jgi:hypothetical protein
MDEPALSCWQQRCLELMAEVADVRLERDRAVEACKLACELEVSEMRSAHDKTVASLHQDLEEEKMNNFADMFNDDFDPGQHKHILLNQTDQNREVVLEFDDNDCFVVELQGTVGDDGKLEQEFSWALRRLDLPNDPPVLLKGKQTMSRALVKHWVKNCKRFNAQEKTIERQTVKVWLRYMCALEQPKQNQVYQGCGKVLRGLQKMLEPVQYSSIHGSTTSRSGVTIGF